MKLKIFTAVAAMTLAAGAAYAATEMKDCCKDKECCCCDKMEHKDGHKPADQKPHH
jgi:hypothetical protein